MQIGVVFPQTEVKADAGAVRTYAQEVERMGFTHIRAYDHVLGANTASRPNWKGFYKLETPFQEPFVLFSYMAGLTRTLRFITSVIILPQRQTALVAKQAACLDVLSEGRFELGVGIGWNDVEYEALGMDFSDRGRRYEDQIEVLRALWTKAAVTIKTPWHTITDAGINPLPIQRPIPIWMGGGPQRWQAGQSGSEVVLRRIARLGDGWVPMWQPDEDGRTMLAKFHEYCREYGRDPAKVGIEGSLTATHATESMWAASVEAWQRIGASHLGVNTMGDGLTTIDQHLRRLQRFREISPVV
jgi:probable F420-dependent oxidoreductase